MTSPTQPRQVDQRVAALGDLYPFQSHFLDVPGGRMHYVDEGEGRPIVLLHGNPTWSFYFRDLIKGLREKYRVIAPDHIGCGLSDKPPQYPYTLSTHIENVTLLLEHLGVSDITLGVHDWGGPIGFGWAIQHPDRVRDYVVFNTGAFLTGKMPLRIRICAWPVFGEIALLSLNAFSRAALGMASRGGSPLSREVRAGYLLPYDSPAHRVAVLSFVRDIPFHPGVPSHSVFASIEKTLPTLADKPMTIFWGMKDFCFTPAFLGEWTSRFPNAVVHRFETAGHYVVEDAHEQILPLMCELLC